MTVPRRYTLQDVNEALYIHENWIGRQLGELLTDLDRISPDAIPYQGDAFPISPSPIKLVLFQDGEFLAPGKTRAARKEAVRGWMTKQARPAFSNAVAERALEMGVSPNRVIVRDQKRCWGSCSSKRTISLNWRLIMAPEEILDYIIIHELAHLRHVDHSRRFWTLVERHCPDYPECEQWISDEGRRLMME